MLNDLLLQFDELNKLNKEVDEKVEKEETKEPLEIPDPLHLAVPKKGYNQNKPLYDYDRAFYAFCRWSATPKALRKPKSEAAWEAANQLPKQYTQKFKDREEYRPQVMKNFWNLMMDLFPDVVYSVYQRAVKKKGSDKAAGIFIDLLSKRMKIDTPKVQVQPMVLMGVPQEKVNALFTPKNFDNDNIIPEEKVKAEKKVVELMKKDIEKMNR